MRIKEISVHNLFEIFNHTIPLNLEERITIIHGERSATFRSGSRSLPVKERHAIPNVQFDPFPARSNTWILHQVPFSCRARLFFGGKKESCFEVSA